MLPVVMSTEKSSFGYIAICPTSGYFLSGRRDAAGALHASLEENFSQNSIFSEIEKYSIEKIMFSTSLDWRRHYEDKRLNGNTFVALMPCGAYFNLETGDVEEELSMSCLLDQGEHATAAGTLADGLIFDLKPYTSLQAQLDTKAQEVRVFLLYLQGDREPELVETIRYRLTRDKTKALFCAVEKYPNIKFGSSDQTFEWSPSSSFGIGPA